MKFYFLSIILIFRSFVFEGQVPNEKIDSFYLENGIKFTIDRPLDFNKKRNTVIVFYALPNGNTTEQTMGKKIEAGDDWHYDIQHIRAQTKFLRREMKRSNLFVIYLENVYKSWPVWKQKNSNYRLVIPRLIDSLTELIEADNKVVYLNGHSGGGSFIFGYLDGVQKIPDLVKRISFIDSDYGYDSSYYTKISSWLQRDSKAYLNVFAYNDSIALFNGKSIVSPKGGTWYKSHLLLHHLESEFKFKKKTTDSLIIYVSQSKQVQFFFKVSIDRGIYHTQQVELNGFIHSILCGTKNDSRRYTYYGERIYKNLIE
ncbi:MAG TPA: hypothetical protein PLU37_03780 [Chitinophagaceae bacterium]|nr:hypothetical protein [Chitinophagales bacterium]HPG10625.1 hypothetical protein [Chitinophagaceae bacterium]